MTAMSEWAYSDHEISAALKNQTPQGKFAGIIKHKGIFKFKILLNVCTGVIALYH